MTTDKASQSFFTILFLLHLIFCPTGEAASVVSSVNRTDESSSLQLYFRFDTLPKYEYRAYKKRIDILFKDTDIMPDISFPQNDDRIIKVLTRVKNNDLTITLFFRYPPQTIEENIRKDPASLMLDILLGNPFSSMYPDLSTKLQGLTLLNRDTIDYTNPINISPYANDWLLFFSEYESPVKISPRTLYTLPPFPLAQAAAGEYLLEEWLPKEITGPVSGNQWQLAAQMLLERMQEETQPFFRDLLLLTYAEALVRAGEYRTPHRLLQQISNRYQNNLISQLADFLFVYVQIEHEPDFIGHYELKEIIDRIGPSTPYSAYFTLLLAETAMEMGQLGNAEKLLGRDDIAFRDEAEHIRALRRGDLHFKNDEKIKSLVAYLQLNKRSSIIKDHPESLARFGDLLFEHNRYSQAEEIYLRLSELLGGKKEHELALFRLAMCRRRNGAPTSQTQNDLFQIQDAFPGTEGAFLAVMKQMDLDYVDHKSDHDKAYKAYGNLAKTASTVDLREEAAFKQALVLLLSGKQLDAIKQCQTILREFQSGKLRVEARALIIQQLPGVITEMVEEGRYIEALVLSQQNRALFARGWIDTGFLYKLATAYSDLGFFDRAARTYQYLFDTSSGEDQEKIYLPLIESLYKDGQFDTIEDYADRFSFRYPQSTLLPQIFYFRLKALQRIGNNTKIAALLNDEERPKSDEIEKLAITFYFDTQQWSDVIGLLSPLPQAIDSEEAAKQRMMLAESLYRTDSLQEAQSIFLEIAKEEGTNEQALYRLGQIDRKNGQLQQALNRFAQIAEKGKDPLWVKLAEEEIALLRIQQKKQ